MPRDADVAALEDVLRFEKYTAKLELETGSASVRTPSRGTVAVQPAASYSKQWRGCKA